MNKVITLILRFKMDKSRLQAIIHYNIKYTSHTCQVPKIFLLTLFRTLQLPYRLIYNLIPALIMYTNLYNVIEAYLKIIFYLILPIAVSEPAIIPIIKHNQDPSHRRTEVSTCFQTKYWVKMVLYFDNSIVQSKL